MNWKSFVAGAAAGITAGFLMNEAVKRNVSVSAESVLAKVKRAFKEDGPIDGSWIQMKAEPYQKHAIKADVYRGGISRQRNGQLQQFEFIADAHTGTVIDIKLI
ncbi:PepSY domain-containing protein [Falsibacillus pallidus]|uniref:Putative small secreted protein n=1 Tax=Falsibacillus pallidus TaxID=493781 RepID=A0A370GKW2_9BACI|nr:PepSY domain-containing protein [Falsibacillus pallidus]RDI44321.1 putative small secreted protein [Falsibacillus pallidus]